jgi:phage gp36-like protein
VAYATLQDLIDRFGVDELTGLTDRAGTGAPDAVVIGRALDDAAQIIDSYLGSRYIVPLNPIDPVVSLWACDIARFLLYKSEVSDAVKARYGNAMKALGLAQDGALALQAGGIDAAVVSDTVQVASAPRTFRAGQMGGF